MEQLGKNFEIESRYLIDRKLSEGVLGTCVYLAQDKVSGKDVMVRILPSALVPDGEMTARFIQGAELAKRLEHPNILKVVDAGEFEGLKFVVTMYEKGYLLNEYLEHRGSLDEKEAVKMVKQVAGALDHAWSKLQIVHRNVCPGTILIARGNVPLLTDFDVAKSLVLDSKLTVDGMAIGDPVYMSPEQARGEELDYHSDMYCLGIVFYQLLCGSPPFSGKSRMDVLRDQVAKRHRSVHEFNKEVSGACESVLDKLLEKDAAKRYKSYEKLLGDLDALLEGREPSTLLKVKAVTSGAGGYKMQAIQMSAVKIPEPEVERVMDTMASAAPAGNCAACGSGASSAKSAKQAHSGSGVKAGVMALAAVAVLCVVGSAIYLMAGGGGKEPAKTPGITADVVGAPAGGTSDVPVTPDDSQVTVTIEQPEVKSTTPEVETPVDATVEKPLENPVEPPAETAVKEDTVMLQRKACRDNVKRISVGLQMYANVFEGKFPDKNGAAGLDMLREQGFVEQSDVFVSPASGRRPAAPGTGISEDACDYEYVGGFTEKSDLETPLLWTKPSVHKDFGIVLYLNGDIKELSGDKWSKFLKGRQR